MLLNYNNNWACWCKRFIVFPFIFAQFLSYEDFNKHLLQWNHNTRTCIDSIKSVLHKSIFYHLRKIPVIQFFFYVSHHFRTLYWVSNRNGQYSIDGGSFDGMKRWKIAEKAIIQNPSGLFYDYSYKKYVQIMVWNGDNIFYKVCSLIIEHPVFYLQTILHW